MGFDWKQMENNSINTKPKFKYPFTKNLVCSSPFESCMERHYSNSISEIKHLFDKLIKLSKFFHTSALRSRELEHIASTNNYKLLRLPKLFTVRWAEFSFSLFNAVVTLRRVLVIYLKNSKEKEAKGLKIFY